MSARKPSNKALAVLGVLREHGELPAKRVAAIVMEQTPCPECDGTGKGDCNYHGCCQCYGRGRVCFAYSDAFTALKQLQAQGLVTRRHPVDEFGDETRGFVWRAVEVVAVDELEALYLAPSYPLAAGHDTP